MFTASSNVIAFTLLGGANNPGACQDFLRPSQLHSVCLVNDYEDGNGGKDQDRTNKEQEEWQLQACSCPIAFSARGEAWVYEASPPTDTHLSVVFSPPLPVGKTF